MKEARINNRNKKRPKYKIVKPFRFFVFILICIMTLVFTGYGIFGLSRADAAPHTDYVQVKVQDNDTLWNIIETYNPDSDIEMRSALYDIYEVNDISAEDIHPGDIIMVPVYK